MKATLDNLTLSVKGLPISIDKELEPHIAAYCGIHPDDVLSYTILKRSLDARKKPNVKLLYRIEAELRDGVRPRNAESANETKTVPAWTPEQAFHVQKTLLHPIVVGAGPAGLFAALALAVAGCKPLLIERGRDVTRRKTDIDRFFETRQLDTESNLLYGEGGAGTWSDGKLFTRVRDPRMAFVLNEFVQAGAVDNIRYFSHPHIGSDKLPAVIASIREKILSLGGSIRWDSEVETVLSHGNTCRGIRLKDGSSLEAPAVLIACGHSARTLILRLADSGIEHAIKGFQIGIRVEHPQEFINRMQFALPDPGLLLGAAEYNLSSRPDGNDGIGGATSFCMCPGGEIIPAVCDPGQLCTNGMSNSTRSGDFANSAIVTSVPSDRFQSAKAAFDFLTLLEKRSFEVGGSDYTAPAQTVPAFLNGAASKLPRNSSYALGLVPGRLDRLLPESAYRALRRAMIHFDKIMPGFVSNGIFIGLETKVSSPVRFERRENSLESSMDNLYFAGEGAGMAGGITSAAIDGVKLAEAMLHQ